MTPVAVVVAGAWLLASLAAPSLIIVEEAPACYRRLAAGKRLSEQLVRRSLPAHSVEDCQQECSGERHFTCEGFNFRLDVAGFGRSVCELSATPSGQLDIGFDLYPDPEYDYYEWDRGGPPECRAGPPLYHHHQGQGHGETALAPRPWKHYGSGWGSYESAPPSWSPRPQPQHQHQGQGQTALAPKPWRPYGSGWGSYESAPPSWRPRPQPQHQHQGQGQTALAPRPWRPYGSGWGSYESAPPSWRPRPQPEQGHGTAVDFSRPPPPAPAHQDCFLRYRSGFRLDRLAVRSSLSVLSVHECEAECGNQKHFICNTFSFRYSLEPSFPRDNCQLSEKLYRSLDPYTDLLPDRDYDVYVRNEHSVGCRPPFTVHKPPARGDIECFVRVRTGQRLDDEVVKEAVSVRSVVDCEIECLRSRYFTCRLFSYRYGSPVIGGSGHNCQLSDWPFSELDPRRDVLEDPDYELYERGSYGHGCELDRRIPALAHQAGDAQCYIGYGRPARLLPPAVKSSVSVLSEEECKAECTRNRDKFIFYCAAFSFRNRKSYYNGYNGGGVGHNCLLTDIEQRDLRPGLDYVQQDGHWLFAWDSRDPRCTSHAHQHSNHLSNFVSTDVLVPELGGAWQKFSVSGRPCRYGTVCSENPVAGFWSCEPEGGDAGSFDYCCRPGHHCGYSEGYDYPWCYVGSASRDQWRPCSEQYFPYRDLDGYGPARYWPVAYLHAEGPPNATVDYPRRTSLQFDGHENYVGLDTYRYSYGKKLEAPPPANRSSTQHQVVEHKLDGEVKAMFEVVDEKTGGANSTAGGLDKMAADKSHKMAADKSVWSWRQGDLEGKPSGRVVIRRRVHQSPMFITAVRSLPVTVTKMRQS